MKHANRFSVADYEGLLADVVHVIDEARHAAARTVDVGLTTTYWLIGRRFVEQEQLGSARVAYGDSSQTVSAKLAVASAGERRTRFPLAWSHYVRLTAASFCLDAGGDARTQYSP
jgi:hypothetical protein